MKWLEKQVKSFLRRNGVDYLPRLVYVDFLGKKYRVRNGTVDTGDYDDAWMLALAHNSKCIFDIGSNIGQSAFIMLQAPNVESVVLVDPSHLALTIAADTLIRNQQGHRIRFVNAFVSDKSGTTIGFSSGLSGHSTGGTADNSDASSFSHQIPTITVDDIVERLNIVPDFMKCDVENFEGKLLIGSQKLAEKQKTRFMMEMHSSAARSQREVTQEVLDWCSKTDYTAWYMKEGTKLYSADPVEHRGRYHLLLQPQSWDYPVWLSKIPQGAPLEKALQAISEQG